MDASDDIDPLWAPQPDALPGWFREALAVPREELGVRVAVVQRLDPLDHAVVEARDHDGRHSACEHKRTNKHGEADAGDPDYGDYLLEWQSGTAPA